MKEANDANHRHLELKQTNTNNECIKLKVDLQNHTAAVRNKLSTATSNNGALQNANLEAIKKNAKVNSMIHMLGEEVKHLDSNLLRTN